MADNPKSSGFLNVERSAKGMRWQARLKPGQERISDAIAQRAGVSELLARVLAARQVEPADVEKFLAPSLRSLLPDPESLTDMGRTVTRIANAINNTQRIAIFGDYDVDGAVCCALLSRYLNHFSNDPDVYIPDRMSEGYGPNERAMRELAEKADLIIMVDCGTNSIAPIAAASAMNTDCIVIDHHQQLGSLPDCIGVVNPNRNDDLSGQGHLCAAGVVFLVLVALNKIIRERGLNPPDLLGWLDILALATVADVVPLIGVNRAFVQKGIVVARRQQNTGLKALIDVSGIREPINSFHLGFVLGPRINAGGRIGDAALGARLLSCDDETQAQSIAETLNQLNRERQAMEAEMLAQAEAEIDVADEAALPDILVVASADWHPGIVGLIASRLKERTGRPAFAIALGKDNVGTGSGRSIHGLDLGQLVSKAVDQGLLISGGGHAMAAGIRIKAEQLSTLRSFLEEQAGAASRTLRSGDSLKIDGAVSARAANLDLVRELERAGPFGAGQPQPVLAFPNHRLVDLRAVGTDHLRLRLQSTDGAMLDGICFRSTGTPLGELLARSVGQQLHFAGMLGENHWQGRVSVQLRVIDAAERNNLG